MTEVRSAMLTGNIAFLVISLLQNKSQVIFREVNAYNLKMQQKNMLSLHSNLTNSPPQKT